MSSQRYAPEFKNEAIRQVVERGISVSEVSSRLGVSTHSLHKWVKAFKPENTEQKNQELLEGFSTIMLGKNAVSPDVLGDTYDTLTPRWRHYHRPDEVAAWFDTNESTNAEVTDMNIPHGFRMVASRVTA